MKKGLIFLLFFISIISFSQESDYVSGTILNSKNNLPLENVNIVNLNKVIGTATSKKGEFEINAQALNPQDYSTGIFGDYHGTATVRIATTLGLSMVSGMTEVLTEKQALGESGAVTPKATMKNAFYHGVSKVSEMEANRQAGELSNEKAYVTVDAGSDLIVSLIAPLKIKED